MNGERKRSPSCQAFEAMPQRLFAALPAGSRSPAHCAADRFTLDKSFVRSVMPFYQVRGRKASPFVILVADIIAHQVARVGGMSVHHRTSSLQ